MLEIAILAEQIRGTVRVVSKRAGGTRPSSDETVIDVDRSSPVLGNPFPMKSPSAAERQRVIGLFDSKLQADLNCNGPITREIHAIADRVLAGEKIALRCWCAPLECHADLLKRAIENEVALQSAPGAEANGAQNP